MHPAVIHVLSFFKHDHLPPFLQEVARPFSDLAQKVAADVPDNQETTVALRKLLEAKDAAVRAALPADGKKAVEDAARKGFETIHEGRKE